MTWDGQECIVEAVHLTSNALQDHRQSVQMNAFPDYIKIKVYL